VQVQNKNEIPFGNGLRYGTALSASAEITTRKDFKFGVAYNHASIGEDDLSALNSIGLTGDAEAVLLGTRAFGERWYAGLTLSRLKNHMTTDKGNYFDATGAELYSQYQLRDRLWLIGGFNALKPDADEPLAGDYRVLYGVFGVRLAFDGFQRMIYANFKLDDSRNTDGSRGANVLTLGVRWKFRQQWSQRALDPVQ
jgi:predicted porin